MQTPLAAIRAMLEALADGVVDDPATVQRYLRTAQRDIQSLSRLMDDVFQMAQWDAGGLPLECQPASLADVISDALESFSALAAQKGVRLEGEAAPDVDPVQMDAPRARHAWAWYDLGRVLRWSKAALPEIRRAFEKAVENDPHEDRFSRALKELDDRNG